MSEQVGWVREGGRGPANTYYAADGTVWRCRSSCYGWDVTNGGPGIWSTGTLAQARRLVEYLISHRES